MEKQTRTCANNLKINLSSAFISQSACFVFIPFDKLLINNNIYCGNCRWKANMKEKFGFTPSGNTPKQ